MGAGRSKRQGAASSAPTTDGGHVSGVVEGEVTEWRRGDARISTDVDAIDLDLVHGFLTTAYWSPGVSRETVERAIQHSLCFGVYRGDEQIGFARVVTDRATFAYLADVFIVDAQRGRGLGAWLIETILAHPDLQGLRRWTLATRDAHGLYRQFGFTALTDPSRLMEKLGAPPGSASRQPGDEGANDHLATDPARR